MQNSVRQLLGRIKIRRAPLLAGLVFVLPILSMLIASLLRVLVLKGDFSLYYAELEGELIGVLRSVRASDSLGSFLSAADPDVRLRAMLLALSPLNLPMLLASAEGLSAAVMLSLLLRLGLASLSLYAFLGAIGCDRLPRVLFSVAYALSSYAIVGAASLSYLDTLILFPCLVLGLLQLVKHRRIALYAVSLALAILTNPAAALSLLLFSALLFGYFLLLIPTPSGSRLLSLGLLLGGTALGITASLAATLPFLSLAELSPSQYPFRQALDFLDFAAKLLPGSYDGLTDAHFPYLSVGVLPLLLIPLFFTIKAIPMRLRIITGAVWFLLYFSFSISAINGLFSLFMPALPLYGHAYLFVFLFASTAAYTWKHLSFALERSLILVAGLTVLICAILQKLDLSYEVTADGTTVSHSYVSEVTVLWLPMIFIILYVALLAVLGRARSENTAAPRWLPSLLAAALVLEMGLSAYELTRAVKTNGGLTDADYTDAFSDSIREGLAATDAEDLFRVLCSDMLTSDDGLYFSYNALSGLNEEMLAGLGISLDENGNLDSAKYPLVLSLLGVRHYILHEPIAVGTDKKGETIYDEPNALPDILRTYFEEYTVLGDGDVESSTILYTSPFALPAFFATSSDPSGIDLGDGSMIDALNRIFRAMTGNETLSLYDEVRILNIFGTSTSQAAPDGYTVYSGERLRIKTIMHHDAPLYFTFSTEYPRLSNLQVIRNGISGDMHVLYGSGSTEKDTDVTLSLGSFNEGDVVEIVINYPNSSDGLFYLPNDSVYLWQENLPAIREAALSLTENALSELSVKRDTLTGKIVTDGDTTLFTSLPANGAFTVKVDGKRVECGTVLGALLTVPISGDGEHTVTISYAPRIGGGTVALSAIGGAAILALLVLELLSIRGRITLPYTARREEEES